MRRLVLIVLCLAAACGKKDSPTTPTPEAATPSRVISVSPGDLIFGDVEVGSSKTLTLTVTNTGNSPMTVTSLSGPFQANYKVNFTSGTIPANTSQPIAVIFNPTEAKVYSGVMRVNCDCTGGNNGVNLSSVGVRTGPLWTQSGTGDNVFDIPQYVPRVRITGDYTRSSSNFIVYVAGKLTVNELIGTSWGSTHFEGTYLVTAGAVQIQSSSGVAWTFTEVR